MSAQHLLILVILFLAVGICTAVTVPQVHVPSLPSGHAISSGIHASPLLSKPVSSSPMVQRAIVSSPVLGGTGNSVQQTTGISIESIGGTTRVSVSSVGIEANDYSGYPSFSSDGRYVAFQSEATNLVSGDGNGVRDIFVHDRNTMNTTRVSVNSAGAGGNLLSNCPSISADGRYVAFRSIANNLVDGDGNYKWDVFVHDRNTRETTRVSVSSTGIEANDYSDYLSISADGQYVAFQSLATNLVSGDGNGYQDVFIHDRNTGETTRVSVSSAGTEGNGNAEKPSISADGQYVAFQSSATNLVSGDGNGVRDIFVHDLNTGNTTRVSVNSVGTGGNDNSDFPSISSDGRYVAFQSSATNLVSGDGNGKTDVFVHDRITGETTRVSVNSVGTEGNDNSDFSSISSEGRYVAFQSEATNLVSGDGNGKSDVFVHDRTTGETIRVSITSTGTEVNADSEFPSISSEGRYVAFQSSATNLVSGDGNGKSDVFVHDCGLTPAVVSLTPSTGVNTEAVSITDLSGSEFYDGATVTLTRTGHDPIPATGVTVESSTRISCTFPITGAEAGQWNVVVKNIGGYSGILENGFTITNPMPTITGLFPNNEVLNTHTASYPVTVTGTNFVLGCAATLNGEGRAATFVNGTEITVTFLEGDDDTTGSYPMVITNPSPSEGASDPVNYVVGYPAPTISSITPNSGVNTGSVAFTSLTGMNFRAGASVNLTRTGQTPITGTGLTITSTNINGTFDIKGKTVGEWNVVVTNTDGHSATKTNGFTVTNPMPTITGLSPNNEALNTHTANYPVTVTGTNFVSGCTATLNGEGRAVTFVSGTEITVTYLEGDDDTTGSYPVVITNPSPSEGASEPVNYEVGYPAPTISSITPNSGVNTGSVSATITGTNFVAGTNTVKLTRSGQADITATSVTWVSTTKITCSLPITGKAVGDWNVVLTTGGQTVTRANGFTLTGPVPTITDVSPKTGSVNKNTQVTITGTNFRSGATVKMILGSTSRTGTVNSLTSNKIICVLPTKGAGTGIWSLKVTNSDTTSVTKTNIFAVR